MPEYRNQAMQKAVALKYEESNAAPMIIAAGTGYLAEKIVEVAAQHNLPVYEDNALATILSQMEVGLPVPQQLYQAIIEIYLYIIKEE